MINKLIAGLAVMFFLTGAVAAKEFTIMIDLNGKGGQCSYRVEYTSRGNFKDKAATTLKTTGVSCIGNAVAVDSSKLTVKLDSVKIKSTLYTDEKIAEIKSKLLKTDFSLHLDNGAPAIDTGSKVPAADYIAWDLYRQLIKLLPAMPDKPIKPGFTWENTIVVPIQTAGGTMPCELYRYYTFKKIKGDTATIVWNFRFAPTDNAVDKTNALEEVPIGGNGSGSAIIDVRNKRLISADMGFSTPVAKVNGISVSWQERAVFTLKRSK
jgi:hypothetical protein